jgi:hypothetical protein
MTEQVRCHPPGQLDCKYIKRKKERKIERKEGRKKERKKTRKLLYCSKKMPIKMKKVVNKVSKQACKM